MCACRYAARRTLTLYSLSLLPSLCVYASSRNRTQVSRLSKQGPLLRAISPSPVSYLFCIAVMACLRARDAMKIDYQSPVVYIMGQSQEASLELLDSWTPGSLECTQSFLILFIPSGCEKCEHNRCAFVHKTSIASSTLQILIKQIKYYMSKTQQCRNFLLWFRGTFCGYCFHPTYKTSL